MLTFNLKRIKALFVKEFYQGFLPTLKIASVVTFTVFFINLIARIVEQNNQGGDDENATLIKYGILLMLGGFAYAAYAFREFAKLPTRADFLALPGSSLEKLSVKWFFTNPVYILLISVLILIASLIFTPFIQQFGGDAYNHEIFSSTLYWKITGIFFVIHSVFLFGSIAFNRVSLIKTLVALILLALVIAALNMVWFRIVWADMFDSLFHFKEITNGNREFGVNHDNPEGMWQVKFWKFAFKYLLAPVMWVASLFKLSEKEV